MITSTDGLNGKERPRRPQCASSQGAAGKPAAVAAAVETSNLLGIGVMGSGELVLSAIPVKVLLTKEQALNAAAWIVALVDPGHKEFERLLEAIKKC